MFLRPFHVRSNAAAKGTERKRLRRIVSGLFPEVESSILDELLPNKCSLETLRLTTHSGRHVSVSVVNKQPLFFECDGQLFPTDLMLPGVVGKERGGETVQGLEKGQTCAVALVGSRLIPAMRVVEASHVEAKQEEIAKRALRDEVIGRIPPLPEQLSAAATSAANVIEVAGQLTAASTIASLDKGCGESTIKQFMMVGGMELKHVGTYQGTLNELCHTADSVIVRMGGYNLLRNNCQHFCNNFLSEIGLEAGKQKTSIGPTTTLTIEDKTFDMSNNLFPIT